MTLRCDACGRFSAKLQTVYYNVFMRAYLDVCVKCRNAMCDCPAKNHNPGSPRCIGSAT